MKPEEMVPSVELCLRLRELGMPQDAYFQWWRDGDVTFLHDKDGVGAICAAPTVAELGEMLPALIGEIKNGVIPMEKLLSAYKRPVPGNQWDIGYIAAMPDSRGTEAEARAKLLIWCAENGHVSWARKEAMK